MSPTQPVESASPFVHPSGAACARLDEGRWHFQHGPIDLIIGAEGEPRSVHSAVNSAWQRFVQVLPELVGELPLLRSAFAPGMRAQGPVAARMLAACEPYAPHTFVTPMAAVAGSVAEEIIGHFSRHNGVHRAYVNNGGDIALHIGPGQSYKAGLFSDLARYMDARQFAAHLSSQQAGEGPNQQGVCRNQGQLETARLETASGHLEVDGVFAISYTMPVRGIATSGWRGRSFSMGIADSVTVLAANAACADVAATLVANQVYVEHAAVSRAPADSLKDDTDLGARLVTVDVGPLPPNAISTALDAGELYAWQLQKQGLIYAAVLMLQGSVRTVGLDADAAAQPGRTSTPDFNLAVAQQRPAQRNIQKESHV